MMEHSSKRQRLSYDDLLTELNDHDDARAASRFDVVIDDKEQRMLILPCHNSIVDCDSSVLSDVMGQGYTIYSCDSPVLYDYEMFITSCHKLIHPIHIQNPQLVKTLKKRATTVKKGLTSDQLPLPCGVRDIVFDYLEHSSGYQQREKIWAKHAQPSILGYIVFTKNNIRVIGVDEKHGNVKHQPIYVFGKEVCFASNIVSPIVTYILNHPKRFPNAPALILNAFELQLVMKLPLYYRINTYSVFALTDLRQSSDPWLAQFFEDLCCLSSFVSLVSAHNITL